MLSGQVSYVVQLTRQVPCCAYTKQFFTKEQDFGAKRSNLYFIRRYWQPQTSIVLDGASHAGCSPARTNCEQEKELMRAWQDTLTSADTGDIVAYEGAERHLKWLDDLDAAAYGILSITLI